MPIDRSMGDHVGGPFERLGRGVAGTAFAADGLEKIFQPGGRDHPQHHQILIAVVIDRVFHVISQKRR